MKKLLVGVIFLSSASAFSQSITILGISNIFLQNVYLTTTAGSQAHLDCGSNKIVLNGLSIAYFPHASDHSRAQATCHQIEDCARKVNGTLAEKITIIIDPISQHVLRAHVPNFCRW